MSWGAATANSKKLLARKIPDPLFRNPRLVAQFMNCQCADGSIQGNQHLFEVAHSHFHFSRIGLMKRRLFGIFEVTKSQASTISADFARITICGACC